MFASFSPTPAAIRPFLSVWSAGMRTLVLALLALCTLLPLPATAADNPSGLPLPRFATTRSTPINVRLGPGTKYDVAWVYVKAGIPVEIVQEFDTWRKIRDFDGSEGWVHQNLLSGKRAGLVAPWRTGEQIPLRSGNSDQAGVRAYLGPGFRVEIAQCDGAWCEITATSQGADGRSSTYSGFLHQPDLWGVYENESFD
jgi:SH3-like domain-containing protein